MKLYMPTKVYNEKNCVENHSRELAALGTRALIVTGKHSSRQNGSLEDVKRALEREGTPYCIFDEVEENPSVDTVMKARRMGAQEDADFVIGVGGGSPMDAAKAIALMLANPEWEEGLLYTKPQSLKQGQLQPAFPVAEVPTTAGTGSEVTPYAILTKNVLPDIELTTSPEEHASISFPHLEKKTKQSISHHIYPALALVDISYLQTSSRNGCIHTAVDTLAHLIESHLNANTTEYSRFYSEMGLRTWAKVKDRLLRYEIGEEERGLLMNACTLGGIAITHTGTACPMGSAIWSPVRWACHTEWRWGFSCRASFKIMAIRKRCAACCPCWISEANRALPNTSGSCWERYPSRMNYGSGTWTASLRILQS